MDRGAWRTPVHGTRKESDTTKHSSAYGNVHILMRTMMINPSEDVNFFYIFMLSLFWL